MDDRFTDTHQLPHHSFVVEVLDKHKNVISCDGLHLLVFRYLTFIINVKWLLLQAKDMCFFSIHGMCKIA